MLPNYIHTAKRQAESTGEATAWALLNRMRGLYTVDFTVDFAVELRL